MITIAQQNEAMIMHKRIWGYLSKHPIWSTVIASSIFAVIASDELRTLLATTGRFLWKVLELAWEWVATTHAVYGWGLIALSVLSTLAVYLLASKAIRNYEIVKKEREIPPYVKYDNEEFYGVTWKWKWAKNSQGNYEPQTPTADCPKCLSMLKIRTSGHLEIECINDKCYWTWKKYKHVGHGIDYYDFQMKLLTEIDRKLKTGEYETTN